VLILEIQIFFVFVLISSRVNVPKSFPINLLNKNIENMKEQNKNAQKVIAQMNQLLFLTVILRFY